MSKTAAAWILDELRRLEQEELTRSLPELDRGADRLLLREGRLLLNLASNNYLGLAGSPELAEAAAAAAHAYGTSAGASRLVTGNYALYDRLEADIAAFKDQEAALVVGSGYAANLSLIGSLADRHTTVFSDRLNHASIVDGIQLAGARHLRYRHNDPEHLAWRLEQASDSPRKLIITDTVFSMDGDTARLAQIVALGKRHGALVAVDEAHAAGILGQGRGLAHALGLEHEVDATMGTFSKAFGSYGAYIAGSAALVALLRNKGRSFIYSTALPPPVVAASLAALELVRTRPSLSRRLLDLADTTRGLLRDTGCDTMDSATQIIPVRVGDNGRTLAAQAALCEYGVYVAAVRPPTVPPGTARLRLSLRADIEDSDVETLRQAFSSLRQRGLL